MPEQRNKKILDGVKAITYRPLIDILHDIDQDFLRETISGEHFAEYFYPACLLMMRLPIPAGMGSFCFACIRGACVGAGTICNFCPTPDVFLTVFCRRTGV